MAKTRAAQIGFPATGEHRERLADLARWLGKPQAEILRQCIDDLWESLPKKTREALLHARGSVQASS